MKSPKSLLLGWTLIVQTWTLNSVEPYMVSRPVNSQPTPTPAPLHTDYAWYRIFWLISSICTILLLFFFSEAFWHVANRFFSIAETILAMAWWLGRPTFLQMSSWTHFGSPTSTRPLIVLGRCSRKLSLTPENSHESKSCFLDRPALLANLHAYTFSPFFF